jgi:hypothetical protein
MWHVILLLGNDREISNYTTAIYRQQTRFVPGLYNEDELSSLQTVSQSKVAAAEARGQFGTPEEGECQPLEAVSKQPVKTQQADKI